MLELYHTHNSVCSQKVRIALAEKGLDWESHHLLLAKGEHRTPEYARLNPKRVVPTLIDDGEVVYQSTVILEYLEDTYPDTPLLTSRSIDRAKARIWMMRIDDDIHDPATTVVSFCIALRYLYLNQGEEASEAWINKKPAGPQRERSRDMLMNGTSSEQFPNNLRIFKRLFEDIDRQLEIQDWLAGSVYSLADLSYAPYITRFERLNLMSILERYPNLIDWYGRLKSRPAYDIAIPQWEDQRYVDIMQKHGGEVAVAVGKIYEDL